MTDRLSVWVMRVMGALNIACFVFGVLDYGVILQYNHHHGTVSPGTVGWILFIVQSAVTICLSGCLAYLGYPLIHGNFSALRPTLIVFVCEILYFAIATEIVWVLLPRLGNRWTADLTGGFLTIPDFVLAPQVATGYPLLGILAIWFLMRRARKRQSAPLGG
jgi:hypothetical protein